MSQKTINEIKIRVADRYPVEDKFDFDEEIGIVLKGEIVKKELKNNQDGTIDLILHFKALDFKVSKI